MSQNNRLGCHYSAFGSKHVQGRNFWLIIEKYFKPTPFRLFVTFKTKCQTIGQHKSIYRLALNDLYFWVRMKPPNMEGNGLDYSFEFLKGTRLAFNDCVNQLVYKSTS